MSAAGAPKVREIKVALRWIAVVLVLVAATIAFVFRPDRLVRAAVGLTAHHVCSATFVAGLDPEPTFRELVRPMIGSFAARLVRYRVDSSRREVSASFAGMVHANAEYTPGYGCRLVYPDNLPPPPPRAVIGSAVQYASMAPDVPMDPEVTNAIDNVFVEHTNQPIKNVKAVVVLKDGNLVAERYAPGSLLRPRCSAIP
jgi:hypothetical protein